MESDDRHIVPILLAGLILVLNIAGFVTDRREEITISSIILSAWLLWNLSQRRR